MIRLERKAAGDYTVHGDAGRAVHLARGLNRRWTVEPGEGLTFKPKEVPTYTEAKATAERILSKPVNVEATGGVPRAPIEAGIQPDGRPGPMRELAAGLRLLADGALLAAKEVEKVG